MEASPSQRAPRRRIRCKMCRQELAGREQILKHGSILEIVQPEGDESETAKSSAPAEQDHESLTKAVDLSILTDPSCSGYFVEPLKWMDHFLKDGSLSGKIICPNARCKAKLGNYDWAGAHCGCKEWVTPGFCINRSKVDEITLR
ncbi:hypothetical protein MD484_g850, partial [Candolleomyces efflorescens]